MYLSNRRLPLRTLACPLLLVGFALSLCSYSSQKPALASPQPAFRGAAALEFTRRATLFGERPSGSESIQRLRDWIMSVLKPLNGQVSTDSFTAQTPAGPVAMQNILVKFPGVSGKALVVAGHYDTKRIPMVHFIGANDAGSSTGFLLELARVVAATKHRDDIYIVFFDGEEAVGTWSEADSRYGSRHLAGRWAADGTLNHIAALINVDMIGDKNLDIANDENSSRALREMVWRIAAKLGDAQYFRRETGGGIDDDHRSFGDAGVNVIDIIDLDYGPNNSYWHTAADTMDKLSAHSLQVVGDTVVQLIEELDRQS